MAEEHVRAADADLMHSDCAENPHGVVVRLQGLSPDPGQPQNGEAICESGDRGVSAQPLMPPVRWADPLLQKGGGWSSSTGVLTIGGGGVSR